MGSSDGGQLFRIVDAAMARATVFPDLTVPRSWPDLDDDAQVEAWCDWLTGVWACSSVAEAVSVASPVLAARLDELSTGLRPRPAQVRRMMLSLARYLLRMRGRATPFGLFAGVAPLQFGDESLAGHVGESLVRARADARWLAEAIARLEASAEVRRRLRLKTNDVAVVHGERVVVLWAPHASPAMRSAGARVSVRRSRVVAAALAAAQAPITGGELIRKLTVEMPHLPVAGLDRMIAQLVSFGVLISALRPTSTSGDGLAHLLACLEDIDARAIEEVAPLVEELRGVHAQLSTVSPGWVGGPLRERMRALFSVVEQPMMVDLRLSAMTLPSTIAEEAAAAAHALARATPHSAGDPRMREFHARFVERYGVGALVGVDQLIDPTAGLEFPAHYDHEDDRTGLDPRVSHRDARLLALAQQAALDGAVEVELSEEFLDSLASDVDGMLRPAPHLEICAEVHAVSVEALRQGEFTLAVRGISRSAFALSGRFLDLLAEEDRQRMQDEYRRLPTIVDGAVSAQLSFPPRYQRLENVAHAPRLLPTVLAVAEHREPASGLVPVDDLAVTADGDRLYVVSLSRRCVVEPVVANATARRAWPPLARLLVDMTRSGTAAVSPFAWGAASCLPFLPRVRYGRSVLCPARWRIPAGALPGPAAPQQDWTRALATLRDRLRLPTWVSVGDADRQLRLNLTEPMDLALLCGHLEQATKSGEGATIAEAPGPSDHGWAGGRPHEITIPLAATTARVCAPAAVTRTAAPTRIGAEHGVLPGERVLSAQLYGHPDHVDAILTHYLPRLLVDSGEPWWWYIRYRDPRPHLRLRLHPSTEEYGAGVMALGAWAADLRRRGLIGDLTLNTYRPETARYGSGSALDAAEALFAADSVAACAQIHALTAAQPPHLLALTAASMVDLAAAMTGGWDAGMRWLLHRRPGQSTGRLPHEEVRQAIRLADPADEQAALRALAGGERIGEAWRARRHAAACYLSSLEQVPGGPPPEEVLVSLLHLHHIRAIGIDSDSEHLVGRMARAVALAWSARTTSTDGGSAG